MESTLDGPNYEPINFMDHFGPFKVGHFSEGESHLGSNTIQEEANGLSDSLDTFDGPGQPGSKPSTRQQIKKPAIKVCYDDQVYPMTRNSSSKHQFNELEIEKDGDADADKLGSLKNEDDRERRYKPAQVSKLPL